MSDMNIGKDDPHNDYKDSCDDWEAYAQELEVEILQKNRASQWQHSGKFQLNDRVTKIKGSSWTGRVVGFYSTKLTPVGYVVESELEKGSVQIYPEAALTLAKEGGG